MNDVRLTVGFETATSIHENGVVFLHLGNGRVFAANKTGARIWRAIEQEKSLNAVAAEISEEYQIPVVAAFEHVSTFVSELERHSLVQRQVNL